MEQCLIQTFQKLGDISFGLPCRVQCFCQNEVEKIRRAYRLNPKSFGLMTPIRPLRVSLEGGAGYGLERKSFFVSKKIGAESPPRQGNPQIMSNPKPFRTSARAPPRRLQCVCQNEVEKMRRAYCLNPKSFGLMTPIRPLLVSLEGGAG